MGFFVVDSCISSFRFRQKSRPSFLLCWIAVSCNYQLCSGSTEACSEPEFAALVIKTRIEISMPDAPKPALEAETIRRMASEEVMLSLTPAEVDAFTTCSTPSWRRSARFRRATAPAPSPR